MNDLLFVAFALLLIVALSWDSRHYPHIYRDKEDRHHRDGRRHIR